MHPIIHKVPPASRVVFQKTLPCFSTTKLLSALKEGPCLVEIVYVIILDFILQFVVIQRLEYQILYLCRSPPVGNSPK